MRHTPKHSVAPRRTRRLAGVTLASAASLLAGLAVTAPAAQADSVWDRVAACESGGNWSINTGNGFYGGLQFVPSTWAGFGGQQYAPNAHQATKSQQIAIAQKVLAVQGPGAWPVCSVKAGLTKSNGGASSSAQAPAPSRQESASRQATSPPAPAPQQQAAPAPQQQQAAPAPQQQQAAPAPQQQAAPAPQVAGFDYTVQPGDTVSALAQRHDTSISAIVSANGLADGGRLILAGQSLVIPGEAPAATATGSTHTVTSGDTLWRIAKEHEVNVEALTAANDLVNPNLILVGQTLQVPAS